MKFFTFYLQQTFVARFFTSYQIALGLLLLFICNAAIFWPGQMFPDSYAQYEAALSGVYGDHHPPMMSVVWGVLAQIIPGSGLLFLLHLLFLYSSAFFFSAAVLEYWWVACLLPVTPPLCFYSSAVWKDVAFSFAYLLACSVISYWWMRKIRPSLIKSFFVILLLFYATAVKFQAQYVLFFPIVGLAALHNTFSFTKKTLLYAFVLTALVLKAVFVFNNYYVPCERKDHSWQLVKLYDLAAISVYQNKPIFPDFVKQAPVFSFEAVKKRFNHVTMDDLITMHGSPLIRGGSDADRTALFNFWCKAVMRYPWSYLKHRVLLLSATLCSIPLRQLDELDFTKYKGLRWFCDLQKSAKCSLRETGWSLNLLGIILAKLLFTILWVIRFLLAPILLVPLLFFYFILALKQFKESRAAGPLMMMSGAALFLLVVLLFFSLASTIRYVYFVICMTHACHPFALSIIARRTSISS